MSSSMEVNATQMLWRPRLIKLTQPAGDGVAESVLYIQPEFISAIRRIRAKPGKDDEEIEATIVIANSFAHHIVVLETPDEVARLRDIAFGFEQKLESVK